MATAGLEEKNKKSKSEEKREHRKRKREEGSRDNKRSRRRKSSKSDGGGGGAGAKKKVRTISELVKLVISGEVKVPKTLTHYVDDRPQLLEQVFTILSENDVRGMLPDILKGLKLRQVRQMCLEQLQTMSPEDITDCIEPPHASSNTLNLDAAVFELLGDPDTPAGEVSGEHQTTSGGGNPVPPATASTDEGRDTSTTTIAESVNITKETSVDDLGVTRGKSLTGDGGGGRDRTVEASPPSTRRESPTLTMECDTTTSDISREDSRASTAPEREEEEEKELVLSDDDSSESDLDDCWLCDFPEELSEWARLREIEFRQRALEAELRRRGEVREEEEEEEEEEEGRERGVDVEMLQGEKVDKSKAIELQLRQRALQSLLAKKKQQQLH